MIARIPWLQSALNFSMNGIYVYIYIYIYKQTRLCTIYCITCAFQITTTAINFRPSIQFMKQVYLLKLLLSFNNIIFLENAGVPLAQAVSRRPLSAEALVRSHSIPCWIFGGQIITGRGFPTTTLVSLFRSILPMLHTHSFVYHCRCVLLAVLWVAKGI
jgi:hypothetical protein